MNATPADDAFATWFFLEFGYRPTPGMIGVDSHRSAWEAGRKFEKDQLAADRKLSHDQALKGTQE